MFQQIYITLYAILEVTLINVVHLHAMFVHDDDMFTWIMIIYLGKCANTYSVLWPNVGMTL